MRKHSHENVETIFYPSFALTTQTNPQALPVANYSQLIFWNGDFCKIAFWVFVMSSWETAEDATCDLSSSSLLIIKQKRHPRTWQLKFNSAFVRRRGMNSLLWRHKLYSLEISHNALECTKYWERCHLASPRDFRLGTQCKLNPSRFAAAMWNWFTRRTLELHSSH